MTTKSGIIALILGGFVLALGIGGVNAADTTGGRWLWGLVVAVGIFVMTVPMLLPWDADEPADKHADMPS
jgi:hypothetical protein